MQIKQFAQACGLSSHTLRYYEKIGLLPAIERSDSNHRRYTEQDRRWIEFIKRLKATNMPLSEIQRYARLQAQGKPTEAARMELLVRHAERLERAIAQEQEHLEKLREKIRMYRDGLCQSISP